ncbi:MAG: ABC transporter substrate binding protein [Methyloligellaceae bacterium]
MRHHLLKTIFILTLIFFSTPLQAAEVLMVLWQGRTSAETGFEERMKQLQPDVSFKYIDAKRDKGKLASALRDYDFSKTDLVYTFGTTGTKIVKSFLKGKKPQVFNMVSAPLRSKIVNSIEKPGHNLTGAKLLVDLDTQFEVLQKMRELKSVGIWFDPREKQNNAVIKNLTEIGKKRGFKIVPLRLIPDSPKIDKLLKNVSDDANKLDALYVVATSSFSVIYDKMFKQLDSKLLVMGGVHRHVGFGATVALAASYKERGAATADIAHQILSGKKAGDIPVNVVTPKTAFLYVDPNKAKAVGLNNIKSLGLNIVERDKPVTFKKKK